MGLFGDMFGKSDYRKNVRDKLFHVPHRDVGASLGCALKSVEVLWIVVIVASCTPRVPRYVGPSISRYVETVCPGRLVEAIPSHGPFFSDVGGRRIFRTDDSMMQYDGGVDLARMDANWSRLVCGMTVGEVDSLINIVHDVNLLVKLSLTGEVVLVLGARSLVFRKNQLVRALGPAR